ncbi:HD domain-containing protein [Francisella hispaniensis]|uniref:HD domain-containing protein n=1 Tax=Francisella hispaniensis TaxID=622488 RepID=UPI001908A14E|nr:HD domain-containing protein [Francisella hispaniensis]MBK2356042.1 HD domain-containing protein [Francisella hispaniensis]
MSQDLVAQLEFISELEKLKRVYRQTWLPCDGNRHENSAEHSWQVALTANIFAEYASVSLDIAKVTKMLLIHDIVEIYSGDTFAFADSQTLDSQKHSELVSIQRIAKILPKSQGEQLEQLWLEFDSAQTDEAKFANAIDRLIPAIQNLNNGGGTWKKHRITKAKVLERNKYLNEIAPKLHDYLLEKLEENFVGDFFK